MTNLPRPINRDEIRKGDKIQVEYADHDIRTIHIGTAHSQSWAKEWFTKESILLTPAYPGIEYSLLDRPKPQLPTEKDAIIRITKVADGPGDVLNFNHLAHRDTDGDWVILVDGGAEYFQPKHILEWNNVTITDVKED